jgi:hypothetical protein
MATAVCAQCYLHSAALFLCPRIQSQHPSRTAVYRRTQSGTRARLQGWRNCAWTAPALSHFAVARTYRARLVFRNVPDLLVRHINYRLVGCNAMQSGESPTFRRSIPPPSSGLKGKRSKKPAEVGVANLSSFKTSDCVLTTRRTLHSYRS